jgi:hypothetical protein
MTTDHRRVDVHMAQEVLLDEAGFLTEIGERVLQEVLEAEHRAWPLVTSFSPLHIYVAPQHLVVTSIHRAGPTARFRGLRTRAMQHPAFRLRRIPLPRTWVNKGKRKGRSVVPRPG